MVTTTNRTYKLGAATILAGAFALVVLLALPLCWPHEQLALAVSALKWLTALAITGGVSGVAGHGMRHIVGAREPSGTTMAVPKRPARPPPPAPYVPPAAPRA